jgi:hypothetical protein
MQDDRGSIPDSGMGIFSSPLCPDQLWGSPNRFFLWVKRPGREADQSPPSSTEVKNEWSYNSTSPYVFIAWCLFMKWIQIRVLSFG